MTTTFENAKVGDRVYDYAQAAWTTIVEIDKVFITTKIRSRKHVYYLDGSSMILSQLGEQVLFWDKPKVTAPPQPPRTKLIHGVEIPDTSFEPKEREYFYYPVLDKVLYNQSTYLSYDIDRFRVENGLCYPYTEEGKQAAILHAKALLGIKD
jgi:hypothetical protein